MDLHVMSVAEAKRRFSEVIERVRAGERILIERRGKPVMALVPPEPEILEAKRTFTGYAAIAGFLSEWNDDEIDEMLRHLASQRRRAKDRPAPDF